MSHYNSSPEYFDDEDLQNGKKKRKSAAGRELIRWDPDKDQLTLLCADYVCALQGVAIPWDAIATQLGNLVGKPNLTGEAIKQHLAKLHKFRVEDGMAVPPKLDRNQRRKALPSANTTPAPGRGRGIKVEEEDAEFPHTPVKPGRSLLFKKEEAKSKRQKKEPAPPKASVGRGGGRKRAFKEEVVQSTEFDGQGGEVTAGPAPKKRVSALRGNKRGRKPKRQEFDEEDEEVDLDVDVTTPNKRLKSEGYEFRPQTQVNYAAQLAPGDDPADGDSETDETLQGSSMKKEPGSSQDSGIYGMPPPQFQLAQQNGLGHKSFPAGLPVQGHDQIGTGYGLGLQNQQLQQDNMQSGFDVNYITGLPMGSDNFDYGGNSYMDQNTNFPQMSQINMMRTTNSAPRYQPRMPNFSQHSFGSPADSRQVTRNNSYDHMQGAINKADGLPANLHLNTQFDGNGSSPDLTTSPNSASSPGETGITPEMRQTGFNNMLNPTLSFDSGYGEGDQYQDMDFALQGDGKEQLFNYDHNAPAFNTDFSDLIHDG